MGDTSEIVRVNRIDALSLQGGQIFRIIIFNLFDFGMTLIRAGSGGMHKDEGEDAAIINKDPAVSTSKGSIYKNPALRLYSIHAYSIAGKTREATEPTRMI
ncbi:MAG: hypothetical protein R3D66_04925 [Alphaproteobacteria bacterium]